VRRIKAVEHGKRRLDGMPDATKARDITAATAAVMGRKDLLAMHDRETAEAARWSSTRTVRE
jgi:hypothetical protein